MKNKVVYTTIGLAVLGISFVQLGGLARQLDLKPVQAAPVSRANAQPVQVEATTSGDLDPQATPTPIPTAMQLGNAPVGTEFLPERISIDAIALDLRVMAVPLIDGTWAVNEGVANYAQGTSLVNAASGNVGIFAHDRLDGFTAIKQLHEGDLIKVWGKGMQATYTVTKSTVIEPTSVSVFYTTNNPELTLITCNGLFSDKRYMVKASLVSINSVL